MSLDKFFKLKTMKKLQIKNKQLYRIKRINDLFYSFNEMLLKENIVKKKI